jgi:murein DD-endopeptidase MepM/ murein hydrolase activator NlpD
VLMSGFDVHIADARRSRTLLFFASLGLALLLIAGFLISRIAGPSEVRLGAEAEAAASVETALAEEGSPQPADTQELNGRALIEIEHALFTHASWRAQVRSIDVTVRRGQTLASVLADAGADRVEAARAIAALDPAFPVRRLRAGQSLTIFLETPAPVEFMQNGGEPGKTPQARLAGLSFRPDSEQTLTVARVGDRFRVREAVTSMERELVRARGEVSSSLYMSAIEKGATDRIVVEMANILGFAVDFRTIQPGDQFDVLFERYSDRRGETVRTGDILHVVFRGRGNDLEYFRYEAPDGEISYYTAEGESAQRLLMRMPINGARISSSFGMRFHPIRRTNRPHNGTDFAAPRGTPIMAAGAGVVERADWFGSFGNYIRIRHANGYQTVYAHLNGFARGVRAGARVQQGQTIGYVGTTGASTGPHLHYEVHKDGRPTNPMSLNLPTGRRLTTDELEDFQATRDRIIALRDAAPEAATPAVAPADHAALAVASVRASGEGLGGAQD